MSETTPLPPPDDAMRTPSEATPQPDVQTSTSTDIGADLAADPAAVAMAEAPAAPASAPATLATPAECAQQLKALFPALFGGAVKPVKLRIQVDIQERAPGQFSKQSLSAFFRRHTGATSYLIAMTKAPHRFDLDGQSAGEITDEHRKVASDELLRRRGNQEERRQLEDQQRRNRAGLLHDFQMTTLTKANFSALKGVPVDELDGLLEIARGEAEERARQTPAAFERPRRPDLGARPRPAERPPRRPR